MVILRNNNWTSAYFGGKLQINSKVVSLMLNKTLDDHLINIR